MPELVAAVIHPRDRLMLPSCTMAWIKRLHGKQACNVVTRHIHDVLGEQSVIPEQPG